MENGSVTGASQAPTIDPVRQTEALAASRRRATQSALQDAEAASARRAEQRENLRGILEQALGANTRVSIVRTDSNLNFAYQAIDQSTGEIILEWPPEGFAEFLRQNGAGAGLTESAATGLLLDESA